MEQVNMSAIYSVLPRSAFGVEKDDPLIQTRVVTSASLLAGLVRVRFTKLGDL